MRVVIQRVSQAAVAVEDVITGQIEHGLVVYLSVGRDDGPDDARFIADKVMNLRIFSDENDKMNLSVRDVGGAVMLISQFTLHGDCRKGRRPGFGQAADAAKAKELYEQVEQLLRREGTPVEAGVFAAHMHVSSCNNGPVTFLLDSSGLF